MNIPNISSEPAVDISLDTINIGKQALVFCSTRKSAESTAEKISKHTKLNLIELSEKILKVLSSPTKQCRKLADCVKKGTAFHHAGLASGQRKLVEDAFRKGEIKVICSTPTLAAGINLPAFRAIIKDLKRYGGRWGMEYIQTLEYHQMAGRAGRPDFNDTHGEAICIAGSEKEAEVILERFINAGPENIYSKLAVEPVLRTFCLSLLATGFARSKGELIKFFEKTFYGFQYGDMQKLGAIMDKILGYLEEWEFIILKNSNNNEKNEFISAKNIGKSDESIEVTKLGERVAQLYLDPYTAHQIITALRKSTKIEINEFSFISMACSTLELRPLPSVRVSETDRIEAEAIKHKSKLIIDEPTVFEPEYDDFLKAMKLSFALDFWMDEKNEDEILEEFNIAPGELHVKKELCDWILFSTVELSEILGFRDLQKIVRKTIFRLDKGVKEELVPLVKLKNIGRVRARILFRNGIKDIGDIKNADLTKLTQLLGAKIAKDLKEQIGEEIEEISKGRRKGQMSVEKY